MVKKKKKIVSIDAKAEVEVEVLEAIVAEMPEVDGVVPEVPRPAQGADFEPG